MFKGIVVTPAECDELRQVAAALPAAPPESADVEDWINRDRLSSDALVEWSKLVFVPPIAALLIGLALGWALRGFRSA